MKLTKELKERIDAYFYSKTPEELLEILRQTYIAGKAFQQGEIEAIMSYNKFTGKEKTNTKPTFDEWLKQITEDEGK